MHAASYIAVCIHTGVARLIHTNRPHYRLSLGGIHKQVSVTLNVKLTLGGKGVYNTDKICLFLPM